MHSYIKSLQEKIDARVFRERLLIFLSVVAFVYILWDVLLQTPIENKKKAVTAQFALLAAQQNENQIKIAELNKTILVDPNKTKEDQVKQLQVDVDALDAKLLQVSEGLVNSKQLPQMLQDVLLKTSKLTLLDVATLPVHELQMETVTGEVNRWDNKSKKNTRVQELRDLGIYEHVVEMRVAGTYFQVVQFVTALEALPWRFYWQRLDYKVTQYPNAEIILRVYTLSSEEGLLGV